MYSVKIAMQIHAYTKIIPVKKILDDLINNKKLYHFIDYILFFDASFIIP